MEKYGHLIDLEHDVGKEEFVAVLRFLRRLVSVLILERLSLIFPATFVQVNTVTL